MAQSLARLDAGISWTRLTTTTDERAGWVVCSDLLDRPGRLVGWQQDAAAAYGGGVDDGRLTGQGLVLDWWLAAIALPAVGVFHLDRRVPELTPDRVWLRLGVPGSPADTTAVTSTGFGCLPDDPAAGDSSARVLDDLDVLARLLRARVVAHARQLLAVYAPTTRIGRRGLWAAVTDAVDVAFLAAGWVSGDMSRAADEADLVLRAPPLVGGSTLHQIVDERGRSHWTRRRYSCCYLYRVPEVAACVTCPRVGAAERRRQATSW